MARNPSYFTSKSQSGSEKGSRKRVRTTGLMAGRLITSNLAPVATLGDRWRKKGESASMSRWTSGRKRNDRHHGRDPGGPSHWKRPSFKNVDAVPRRLRKGSSASRSALFDPPFPPRMGRQVLLQFSLEPFPVFDATKDCATRIHLVSAVRALPSHESSRLPRGYNGSAVPCALSP